MPKGANEPGNKGPQMGKAEVGHKIGSSHFCSSL